MKISRHARNNMRLYKITEKDIMKTVESPDSSGREGGRLTALREFKGRFSGYPLKVVYREAGGELTVITAYPLKKKHWR